MLGTTTEGNVNADDLTVATSGEGGITIRTGAQMETYSFLRRNFWCW